jgi:hypothetical protein
MKPLVYRGSREICAAAGLNWKKMSYYVQDLKLPAFKIRCGGQWLACHEDLERWIEEQKERYKAGK